MGGGRCWNGAPASSFWPGWLRRHGDREAAGGGGRLGAQGDLRGALLARGVQEAGTSPSTWSVALAVKVTAAGPQGAAVTFTASATDQVDGDVPVSCTPASGATFPVGATEVACRAEDAAGNVATGGFTVTVTPEPTTPAPPGETAAGSPGARTSDAPAPPAPAPPVLAPSECPVGSAPFLPTFGPWDVPPDLSSPCYRLVKTGEGNLVGTLAGWLLVDVALPPDLAGLPATRAPELRAQRHETAHGRLGRARAGRLRGYAGSSPRGGALAPS